MSKERIYTGYAIVSKDIMDDNVYRKGAFGISLDGRDLETCKRYCHEGQIVVRTYQDVLSRDFKIRWIRKYPIFSKSHRHSYPRYIQLGHLKFEWSTEYTNGYERKAVYQPE
jgi:hypothetical protein